MNEWTNEWILFSFLSYFKIQNIEYKIRKTKKKHRYKILKQNTKCKKCKMQKCKIIIELIKVTKNIVSYSKYTLSTRA